MEKLKQSVDRILLVFTSSILVSMVLIVLWQIYTRYILKESFTNGEEAVRLLLIWLAVCGGAYCFGSNGHLALDFFTNKLSDRQKQRWNICIHSIVILFTIPVLIVGGIIMVNLTATQLTPAIQLPVSYQYLAMPIGGIIILFYETLLICDLIKKV